MQHPENPYYRARGYPYFLPDASYVMSGTEYSVVDHDDHLPDLHGRRPILAVGSNMSPWQLGRKFPVDDSTIPVTRVRLEGFDTVFSTHFTRYGAIPATLFPSAGTEVTLFINWLDPAQEQHMHSTEIAGENYKFCRLDDVQMTVENGPALDHVYLYVSGRGALSRNGVPVPMAEAPARNRQWEAMTQDEVQDHARRMLSPHQSPDDFTRENINDDAVRRQRTDRLHETAMPFHYSALEIIES